jgi:hypothetical protein
MTIDILIYLKRGISDTERAMIDQGLRKIHGIVAPWFTPRSPSTMLVYFNPELTSSGIILAAIRRFGFDARIVAM